MRNLILFLTRNYYILLFLTLETFAVFLVIQNNHFQRAHFLNSSNVVSGSIYQTYSGITDYFGLKYQNKKLAKENIVLRNQLRGLFSEEMRTGVVKDRLHNQQYIYMLAKVVNNSTNRRKNYLTLNIGSKQGVKTEMAVISSDGIVGIVRDVSDNFSSVMSLLHESIRIPVTIKKFGKIQFLPGTETMNGMHRWSVFRPTLKFQKEIRS